MEAAHARGIAVILDVVYNHFGPEGNYLGQYAPQFFTRRHRTPWGDAVNFDGPDARPVRDFVIENAVYWIEVFHLDGLRIDAAHAIKDDSRPTFSMNSKCGRKTAVSRTAPEAASQLLGGCGEWPGAAFRGKDRLSIDSRPCRNASSS